jgi:hypothetical protein
MNLRYKVYDSEQNGLYIGVTSHYFKVKRQEVFIEILQVQIKMMIQ